MNLYNQVVSIVGSEYRPCIANGRKAFFHRWVDEEKLIVKSLRVVRQENIDSMMGVYEKTGFLPNFVDTDKITKILALVEFEDGTVEKVDIGNIKFLDGGTRFMESAAFCIYDAIEKGD